MFNNADVNRCPYKTFDLYDMTGVEINALDRQLITINETTGFLDVDESKFQTGTGPKEFQLGMTTGFTFNPTE